MRDKKVLEIENYADDFSAGFTDRSQVDKGYVDNAIANIPPPPAPVWGTITGTLANQTDLNTQLKKIKALALAGI